MLGVEQWLYLLYCARRHGESSRPDVRTPRDRGKKLDGIIIETTGMANPAPVVQTFFADKALSNGVFLDGVITVVDAKHISTHLDKDGGEAVTQLAYADRVILNKIDLVSKDELKTLNEMIFKVNSTASIFETIRAQVDIKYLLRYSCL